MLNNLNNKERLPVKVFRLFVIIFALLSTYFLLLGSRIDNDQYYSIGSILSTITFFNLLLYFYFKYPQERTRPWYIIAILLFLFMVSIQFLNYLGGKLRF